MSRQAVILAGGLGTRLQPVTGGRPKTLAEIGGVPVLGHQLALCHRHGFDEVVLLLGHGADAVRAYVGDGAKFGVSARAIVETQPLGSAGAVLAALDQLAARFLVLYGDAMLDVDLERFWQFHERRAAGVSILVHPNDHPFDSDLVVTDAQDRVLSFSRWRADGPPMRNLVSAALYTVERSALAGFDPGPETVVLDFGRQVFPELLRRGGTIAAYRSVEYIKDMGTPERLARVNRAFAAGIVDPASSGRSRAAIFLDRDGTINLERNGILEPEELVLEPEACEAIARLNRAGLPGIIVTNQPYISHGRLSETGLDTIHAALERELAVGHAFVDAIYHCPHHPHAGYPGERAELKIRCSCRKPETGMISSAAADLNLDLARSWMIGDQTADIEMARRAGLRSILVRTGHAGRDGKYPVRPDFVCDDLNDATRFITEIYPRLHARALDLVADLGKPRAILIGGLARAGKSTWASLIAEALRDRGAAPLLLSLDDWLLDEADRGADVLARYDLPAVAGLIDRIVGATMDIMIEVPVYDRAARRRLGMREHVVAPGSVPIVEGVPALALTVTDAARISVTIEEPVRLRRFQAFYRDRRLDEEAIMALWRQREDEETGTIMALSAGSTVLQGMEDAGA